MVCRKSHDAFPDYCTLILLLQRRSWIVGRVFDRACGLFVQLLVRPAPERRESLKARDGQHPSRHRRAPLKSTSLTPHVEKHLADEILSHALVAHETHHEPKPSHMMPRVEHLHSQPIAVRDSSDQHFV